MARMPHLSLLLVALTLAPLAGRVDTLSFHSSVLDMTINYIVVVPATYDQQAAQGKRFPVVYLLHCAGCGALDWCFSPSYCPPVSQLVDSVSFIMAAPDDGNRLGWWLDSPKRANSNYSSFLVNEFKPRIDSLYATLRDRDNTGVTGHSMGGFGAFHTIIDHPDVFAAAFSIKGGLDPCNPLNVNWPSYFGLDAVLGTAPGDSANWRKVNVLRNACTLAGKNVHLGMWNGAADTWFRDENRRCDTILSGCGIAHLFHEGSDPHSPLTLEEMTLMTHFFDSLFIAHHAAVKKPDRGRPRLLTPKRVGSSGPSGARFVKLTGQFADVDGQRMPRGSAPAHGLFVLLPAGKDAPVQTLMAP